MEFYRQRKRPEPLVKIERETSDGRNAFTGYGEGYVDVNRERHTKSLVVSANAVSEWRPQSAEAITAADIAAILDLQPEVVLIGTGATFGFPDPASLAPLHAARIGAEVMDTRAACRTYNLLVAEGRNVVAALIL
jgi:uncharacterized protein